MLTLLMTAASCRKSGGEGNANGGDGNRSGEAVQTFSTPPFSTKEPERYQAVRVETSSEGPDSFSTETFIARDGERRREDYRVAGLKVSLLQLPAGAFVLLPERKLYAELKPGAGADNAGGRESAAATLPDFSPDRLLNAVRPEASYEKLGPETVNGRATTKYRVTLHGRTGAAKEVVSESLVWVEESLGLTVKSETTSGGEGAGAAKYTMELRDIKEGVDASVFDLPADYSKVDFKEISAQLKTSGKGP